MKITIGLLVSSLALFFSSCSSTYSYVTQHGNMDTQTFTLDDVPRGQAKLVRVGTKPWWFFLDSDSKFLVENIDGHTQVIPLNDASASLLSEMGKNMGGLMPTLTAPIIPVF